MIKLTMESIETLKELNKEIAVQSRTANQNNNKYLLQKKTEIELIFNELKQKVLSELETSLEDTTENETSTNEINQKKKPILISLLSQLSLNESEKKKLNNNFENLVDEHFIETK